MKRQSGSVTQTVVIISSTSKMVISSFIDCTMTRFLGVLVCFLSTGISLCRVVKPSGNCVNDVCHFEFNVNYKFTMMQYNYSDIRNPEYKPVVVKDSILQRRAPSVVTCEDEFTPISKEEFRDTVSPGDGDYKLVYAINGQIPGPDIVVYEDQVISVTVRNQLRIEALSIHWHGMIQRGTPWMDGTAMISQCPILPGQTFQYRFLASPSGTHWYHGHTGTLRSDGIVGALIVLPRIRPPIHFQSEAIPDVHAEFIAIVTNWFNVGSLEKLVADVSSFGVLEEYDGKCEPLLQHPDESGVIYHLNTGLVNGRGRKYILNDINAPEKPWIPLEKFIVIQNRYYRFRVINSAFTDPLEISIDDHMLIIVAFDGQDVDPFKADSVAIQPAERVDFIIFTGRPIDNYYINFFSTATKKATGEPIIHPDRTHAVLNYYGEDDEREPRIMPRQCRPSSPCVAVNRVYGLSPAGTNTVNVPLTHLTATQWTLKQNPVPIVTPGVTKQLFFLNFALLLPRGPQINGRRFVKPTSPLQTYPGMDAITPCGTCTSNECDCTHILKFDLGNIIEIVISAIGVIGISHPVHIHGHHFHVLKMAYPPYDPVTGNTTGPNPDIRCLNERCTEATWADPSWNAGYIPGVNLENPPLKDTISVPANGYVIIRLRADNPGFWFLHCHFAHHHLKGMSLVIQEGEVEDMAPVPSNFPTCSDFQFNAVQWQRRIRSQRTRLASKGIIPNFKSGLTLHSELQNDDRCRLNPWMCKTQVY
ncbi:uncharacterized protein LOC130048300 [Ostrea edulis]|uniref:uncharacterized protein LOC130048300 n=1 Tax=Ostrea edulis TaxID=37623 RepID=UPI0024AFFB90|nr:uncharacterized protein LOC130048300 [Ostrea edulis]